MNQQPNIAYYTGSIHRDDLIGTNFEELQFIPFVGFYSAVKKGAPVDFKELFDHFELDLHDHNTKALIPINKSTDFPTELNNYLIFDNVFVPNIPKLKEVALKKKGDHMQIDFRFSRRSNSTNDTLAADILSKINVRIGTWQNNLNFEDLLEGKSSIQRNSVHFY